jgi:dihydroflavonol-4-reductase
LRYQRDGFKGRAALRVFITGATGFVGGALVKRLASTKHEMRCLVRNTSHVRQLEECAAERVVGDVLDRESLLRGMAKCDWTVNLANVYSFWEPDRRVYSSVNIEGTRNVMECALEAGVSKVVHVSTFVVYGQPADDPFTEESEVGPVRFSEYARTKHAGDLVAWRLREDKGLPLVVIYPGAVLGAGDPKATGQYVRNIVERKLPARVFENNRLTFVYVGDVADSIVRALERSDNIGQGYLVGKYALSYRECNNLIKEIAAVRLPRMSLPDLIPPVMSRALTLWADITKRPPLWGMAVDQIATMKRDCCFDGSKAERELGLKYTPIRTALEEAIRALRPTPAQSR